MDIKIRNIINMQPIYNYIGKHNLNECEFCEICGIPYPTISLINLWCYDVPISDILKIADTIGVQIKDLFIYEKKTNLSRRLKHLISKHDNSL